jgi:hypothetical protein
VKRLSIYLLCCWFVVAPACQAAPMTPQQQNAAAEAIDAEYRAKRLTRKQRDAALEALEDMNDTAGFDWNRLLQGGVNVLLAVLLSSPIAAAGAVRHVMKVRGPVATPEERARRLAAKT